MILYGYYRSSTSYRTRIGLNLKSIDYKQIPVNLKAGEQSDEAFSSLNPHRTVPLLDVGEQKFVQSLAILDWLEINYPSPSFVPYDRNYAQVCRELYYAVATEIHAPNNLPILRYLKAHFQADDVAIEKWYATWIHRTFEPIEARLSAMRWLSEELPFGGPSLFEIVLIPQIYNAQRWNTDLSNFPNLMRVNTHCTRLSAFADAHPKQQPDAPED